MTKQVICYISGPNDMTDRKAVSDYAAANGLGSVKSDACISEVVPGVELDAAITSALPGAVFVTNSLLSFGVRPSEQRAHIFALATKDVDVHVVGLGQVDPFDRTMRACWEAASELERQHEQLQRDYAESEQRHRDRMASFEDKLVARMSEVVGTSSIKQFYGANGGHAPEPEPQVVSDPTALHIRQLRESKGWSQEQLAERAGCTRSMVQRAETVGRCAELGKIVSVLEHGT